MDDEVWSELFDEVRDEWDGKEEDTACSKNAQDALGGAHVGEVLAWESSNDDEQCPYRESVQHALQQSCIVALADELPDVTGCSLEVYRVEVVGPGACPGSVDCLIQRRLDFAVPCCS